jgi:hypothetical protein
VRKTFDAKFFAQQPLNLWELLYGNYDVKIKADHWVHISIDPLSTKHAIANTMLGQQLDHPTQEVSMISHYSPPESLCPHSATRTYPSTATHDSSPRGVRQS